ncbi:MAG: hypothetical protein KAR06_03705 [Deltaproteobacteria bacterium]|nr:hypothetical protein [Deltaproteobacteria bacterium]
MYSGIIKGSKTIDFGTVILGMGVIEQNLPLVREQLGDYYGFIVMGIGIGIIVLRKMTTKPLAEK